ncbi:MAG: hypothetical protein SF123_01005 [Chloroflexota bacterium]|nr:hypothetical protein [Chloroflexota bacterium]
MTERTHKDTNAKAQPTARTPQTQPEQTPLPVAPSVENILMLQRLIGNQAVGRMMAERNQVVVQRADQVAASTTSAPARPEITPDVLNQMDAQVEWIVSKLKEWRFDDNEQSQVIKLFSQYWNMDFDYHKTSGYVGSDYMDKFLSKLKIRTFTDDTYATFGIEKTQSVHDALWSQLNETYKSLFMSYISDSKNEKTTGPLVAQERGFWETLGKQEAMGLWGLFKGLGTGLTGLMDAGAGGIVGALKLAHVPIEDPIKLSQWVEKQFDESGEIIFGKEFKEGEGLVGGLNAAEIGTAGGSLIWQLTMIGAGNANVVGETAAWAQKGKTAVDVAGNFNGMVQAGNKIGDVVAKHQKSDVLDKEGLFIDAELYSAVSALAMNIGQALMGGKGLGGSAVSSALQESFKRLGYVLTGTQMGQTVDQIVQLATSTKLEPLAKEKAISNLVIELVKQGAGIVAETHGDTKIGGKQSTKQGDSFDPNLRDFGEDAKAPSLEIDKRGGQKLASPEDYDPNLKDFGEDAKAPSLEIDARGGQKLASPEDYDPNLKDFGEDAKAPSLDAKASAKDTDPQNRDEAQIFNEHEEGLKGMRVIEDTPSGKGVQLVLDETCPPPHDLTGQKLLEHAQRAIEIFNDTMPLSEAQIAEIRTLEKRGDMAKAKTAYAKYRGSAIDGIMKGLVENDNTLEHVYVTVNREKGIDFFDAQNHAQYDLTTKGAWNPHIRKYHITKDKAGNPINYPMYRIPTEYE